MTVCNRLTGSYKIDGTSTMNSASGPSLKGASCSVVEGAGTCRAPRPAGRAGRGAPGWSYLVVGSVTTRNWSVLRSIMT
jgi:hypothetical protein